MTCFEGDPDAVTRPNGADRRVTSASPARRARDAAGRYHTPSRLRRVRGVPHLDDADPRVLDSDLGAALWTAAVMLTDVDPACRVRTGMA